MPTPVYAAQGTSIVRRTAVALAVAGVVVIFIAGALVRSPIGSRDVSAAFARPAEAAAPAIHTAPLATGTVAPAAADEWDRISEPRECDLANGISTVCLFMD